MKASDITDGQFLSALNPDGQQTRLDELVDRLGFPRKVVLAKAETMVNRRGTVDGCTCGCSGQFFNVAEWEQRTGIDREWL